MLLTTTFSCFLFDWLHLCLIERKICIHFLHILSTIKAKFSLSGKIDDWFILLGNYYPMYPVGSIFILFYLPHWVNILLCKSLIAHKSCSCPPPPLTTHVLTRDALDQPVTFLYPIRFAEPYTTPFPKSSFLKNPSQGLRLPAQRSLMEHPGAAKKMWPWSTQHRAPGSFPREELVSI